MNKKNKKAHTGATVLKVCGVVCLLGLMSPTAGGASERPDFTRPGTLLEKTGTLQVSLFSGWSAAFEELRRSVARAAPSKKTSPTVRQLEAAIRNGQTDQALSLMQRAEFARTVTAGEYDRLRLSLARAILQNGGQKSSSALSLAQAAQRRSAGDLPEAGWVAGLSAWRSGNFEAALSGFSAVAAAEKNDEWVRAAGAFWGARAADRLGRTGEKQTFLKMAATYPKTFYGLLAAHALGQTPVFDWTVPAYAQAHEELLSKTAAGKKAIEYAREGRLSAADRALQDLSRTAKPQLQLAALGFATRMGLPASALKLAGTIEKRTGIRYDVAYYPVGGWINTNEYDIDPALVHAIIRQESAFNPRAQSGKGARGLMQLMPSTARQIADKGRPMDLSQSLDNLELGQRYLQHLMKNKAVDGDLLRALIAYNAGPGNLSRWKKKFPGVAESDPLLFMELIPAGETRVYVERVMANYWIYSDRMGKQAPERVAWVEDNAL